MKLAQLQQLMTQGADAQTQLAGLDAPTARAAALRDQPLQNKNVASGLISVLGRELGRSRERDLAPQRAAATGDVNRLGAAVQMQKMQQEQAQQTSLEQWRNQQTETSRLQVEGRQTAADQKAAATATKEATRVAEKDAKIALAEEKAALKKEKPVLPPVAQQKQLERIATETRELSDVLTAYKPDYAGSGYPMTGTVANFISREAPIFSDEDMKSKQSWWSDYSKTYELVTRHELFGSALTKGEQEQWRMANINPNMTSDQIEPKLKQMQKLKYKIAQQAAENALIKGWDEKWVMHNLGSYLEADAAGAEPPIDAAAAPTTLEAEVSEVSAVPQGIDPAEWAGLSPEDQKYFREVMQGST